MQQRASTALIGLGFVLLLPQPVLAGNSVNCPPFPPPDVGDEIIVVTPAQAGTLPSIVAGVAPFTTILLNDGLYSLTSSLNFNNPYVTLRSASGDADAVVLDGEYSAGAAEIIRVSADHVSIADLTVKRAWFHPIHITGGGHFATLYNLKIRDGRQQFVKVNSSNNDYADFGVAACLDLELTAAGRAFVEQNPSLPFLCYTGGLDFHETWGWTVRDSEFRNIYCTDGGLAEHAIHFFKSNREPLVERNLILNCARGIGFGLGQLGFERTFADNPFQGTAMDGRQNEVMQIGGTIRNNVIHADIGQFYDLGIGLESAWKPDVLHNTVYSEDGSFNSAIDIRFSGSVGVNLTNNLYYPVITVRSQAPSPAQSSNVFATSDLFANLGSGNLHLVDTAFAAIDQGVAAGVVDDIDGDSRDASPDVGADESAPVNNPPAVAIASPLAGSSYDSSTPIGFVGTASDDEDGDLTAGVSWSSSLDGVLGVGGSFSATVSAGAHVITASVSDSGGLGGSEQVGIVVTSTECPLVNTIASQSVNTAEVHRAVDLIEIESVVAIENGGDLTLRAGQLIEIGDGFSVLNGGIFCAGVFVNPCS